MRASMKTTRKLPKWETPHAEQTAGKVYTEMQVSARMHAS